MYTSIMIRVNYGKILPIKNNFRLSQKWDLGSPWLSQRVENSHFYKSKFSVFSLFSTKIFLHKIEQGKLRLPKSTECRITLHKIYKLKEYIFTLLRLCVLSASSMSHNCQLQVLVYRMMSRCKGKFSPVYRKKKHTLLHVINTFTQNFRPVTRF